MANKQLIEKMAKDIREKMVGGTLLGESIDENDIDTMIVAAYNLARSEEINNRLGVFETLRSGWAGIFA